MKSRFPSLFKKPKGIRSFDVPAGARGHRRASRSRGTAVFPGNGAGPQAFRLSLRKLFGPADEGGEPGRFFRRTPPGHPARIKISLPPDTRDSMLAGQEFFVIDFEPAGFYSLS